MLQGDSVGPFSTPLCSQVIGDGMLALEGPTMKKRRVVGKTAAPKALMDTTEMAAGRKGKAPTKGEPLALCDGPDEAAGPISRSPSPTMVAPPTSYVTPKKTGTKGKGKGRRQEEEAPELEAADDDEGFEEEDAGDECDEGDFVADVEAALGEARFEPPSPRTT